MNDLGLTLAWLTVQVAIFLAPALALHALASLRGPVPGAWVATLSLGLVVALNAAAVLPAIGLNPKGLASAITPATISREGEAAPAIPSSSRGRVEGPDVIQPAGGRDTGLARLQLAWDRVGRGVSEPAVRFRPWVSALAAVAMAGTVVGLLRLTIGLWAVALCCRRGRPVDDPAMTELLDELQFAMRCRRLVTLREVPDLTTPATARRRRPVVLLPDDWRSWSAAERRAVLAHELAHIVRGDYVTGLLARLAVVLNYYHPFVRWMAARLQLQQEQAADALGARFAGGTTRYLVALSSLALRQDGRSPCWPARAFLPARGTLIRRITMLRDQSQSKALNRTWSSAHRLLAAFALIGLTIGVAMLRGPARGAEDGPSPSAKPVVAKTEAREPSEAFVAPYVLEGMDGAAVIRPAAAFRQKGLDPLLALFRAELDHDLPALAKQLKVDTSRPGFLKLRLQDIEWATAGVGFDRSIPKSTVDKQRPPADAENKPLHRFSLGGPVVRMVAPFDWLAFLRQWRFECQEVRVKGRAYYKITGEIKRIWGGTSPCFFLPDDRTIVFAEEDPIRKIAGGDDPAPPAYLRGKEWERASRGLVAIAIKNHDDSFTKHYDLGRPDDAVVLSLFKGVDWWVIGVDDADPIVLHADASCRNRDASEAITRSLDSLIKLGRRYSEHNAPKLPDGGAQDQSARMLKSLAANVRVVQTDNAITVRAQNFGSLADYAAIVTGEAREAKARSVARQDAKNSVKR
jgi:beta-lactamase regulating signal transducer with metallopeptidase domain